MKTLTKQIIIHSPPEKIFAYMDQVGNTGMHMMKNSGMMMGSKLNLQQVSENALGINSKYRRTGSILGYPMDFIVVTTKWIEGKEKVWETVGIARMMILRWYQCTCWWRGLTCRAQYIL